METLQNCLKIAGGLILGIIIINHFSFSAWEGLFLIIGILLLLA